MYDSQPLPNTNYTDSFIAPQYTDSYLIEQSNGTYQQFQTQPYVTLASKDGNATLYAVSVSPSSMQKGVVNTEWEQGIPPIASTSKSDQIATSLNQQTTEETNDNNKGTSPSDRRTASYADQEGSPPSAVAGPSRKNQTTPQPQRTSPPLVVTPYKRNKKPIGRRDEWRTPIHKPKKPERNTTAAAMMLNKYFDSQAIEQGINTVC